VTAVKVDDPAFMLERMLMDGKTPDIWQMHRLGLDTKYLERIYGIVKNRIYRLQDFRPLREMSHSGRTEQHQRKFAEATLADIPCLRISHRRRETFSGYMRSESLLKLYPKNDLSTYAGKDIDLFVTARGEWIVYDGRDLSDDSSFAVCRSLEELNAYFDALEGEKYQLGPSRDTVYFDIANRLIGMLREDVERLKQDLAYHEATVAECDQLQDRMRLK